jgi:hypothetical protein
MSCATVFEEHSEVLAHWFANGVGDATLIYLDAHLDLQFIDPARIARLAACTSAEQLARLESPHCLSPDRSACYGIEDFLYPAAQLGMLRRVVWVAPPHVLHGGMAVALRGLLQMEGVTIDELESFHVGAGGALEGRLLGVELTICVLEQLPALALAGPLLVDIDADYFVVVPADVVWARPAAVVAALKHVAGPQAGLTIARSVGSGFMPLRYGHIADDLAALWQGRDHEVAPPIPDDLVRRLCEFRARRIRLDLARLLALQREVAAAGLAPARQAIAWIALGRLFTVFQRLDDAIACDEKGGRHPELALEIAKLHMARGQFAAAAPYLERAAGDDETRVGAWLLQAECRHAAGDDEGAAAAARKAHRAAPAWPLALQRLAAYAGPDEAPALRERHGTLERRIGQLAARLA